jgi:hypothetical protein
MLDACERDTGGIMMLQQRSRSLNHAYQRDDDTPAPLAQEHGLSQVESPLLYATWRCTPT